MSMDLLISGFTRSMDASFSAEILAIEQFLVSFYLWLWDNRYFDSYRMCENHQSIRHITVILILKLLSFSISFLSSSLSIRFSGEDSNWWKKKGNFEMQKFTLWLLPRWERFRSPMNVLVTSHETKSSIHCTKLNIWIIGFLPSKIESAASYIIVLEVWNQSSGVYPGSAN